MALAKPIYAIRMVDEDCGAPRRTIRSADGHRSRP
jgi:hypothetical protein